MTDPDTPIYNELADLHAADEPDPSTDAEPEATVKNPDDH